MEEGRRVAYEGTGETAAREVTSASEIGERIAAIPDAAEGSAERIRAEARAEAAEILHRAHERAAARVAELTHEANEDVRRIEDEGRRRQEEMDAQLREVTRTRDSAIDNVRAAVAGLRDAA